VISDVVEGRAVTFNFSRPPGRQIIRPFARSQQAPINKYAYVFLVAALPLIAFCPHYTISFFARHRLNGTLARTF